MNIFVLGFLVLLTGPIALIATLINRSRIAELERTVAVLRDALHRLNSRQALDEVSPERKTAPAAQPIVRTPEPVVQTPPQTAPAYKPSPFEQPRPSTPPQPKPARQTTIERQFGGRAFVWLGGIALALAGFFLVKYSIDTGLLTEKVRVVLGVLFGLSLLAGSGAVRRRKNIADGTRIAQALAGAGIADLYGSLFAATTLYHLLPAWLGFSLMAVVTAVALVLSLRHGAPIAALGLIGGYATPLMVAGEPNAPLLFSYLYLVFGGLSLVIRRQHWQWLTIPTTLIAFAWVGLWLVQGLAAKDGVWLSLFLAGVSATAVIAERGPQKSAGYELWPRYLAPVCSLVLMASVTYASHFGTFEWAMFGLLSAGAIVLAWFDDRTYAVVPWMALAANIVMLLGWQGADPSVLAAVIAAFALLFFASAQYLLSRSTNPVSWAGLSAAAGLAYFLLAYDRLNDTLAKTLHSNADGVWALIAVIAAGLFTYAVTRNSVLQSETPRRHVLQGIFATAATALLSLGFAILLHHERLPFAIATEVFALSWIGTRVDIPALRYIALALSGLYAALILLDVFPLFIDIFTTWRAAPNESAAYLVANVVFRFALPGAMLAAAAQYLRKAKDDEFVAALEFASVALFAVTAYRIIAIAFSGHPQDEALFVQSIVNDIVLLLALASLLVARLYARPAVLWGGVTLGAVVLARIVVLGLVVYDPLWSHQLIGTTPVFNTLLLVYAFPAVAAVFLARDFAGSGRTELSWIAAIAAFALSFIYVSMNVRQIYAGTYLDQTAIGNAEVYTYSAVWLVCGVALLFAAVLRRDFAMRVASLVVMLVTVGKVFLYDASELTGLWRVVSFLGLGLCLLALSWFYTRFVFVGAEAPAEAP
jgi:uncharacterized membrane protein